MPYFACTLMLDHGSIVRPGNWGRIVRLTGPNHTEWQREVILEEIRKSEFAHLPSRLESAFVIDELEEAQYYAANFVRLALLYEVTLIDDGARTQWLIGRALAPTTIPTIGLGGIGEGT
jgi:Protein of unknown function (DUF2441)